MLRNKVAQTCSLYRGFSICWRLEVNWGRWVRGDGQQNGILRYSRLQVCATQVCATLLFAAQFLILAFSPAASGKDQDWPRVGGDPGGSRYSSLDQINRRNVKRLRVAWTYHTGDAGKGTTLECTPIAIDGTLFLTTVNSRVVALDAATGKQLWLFDPQTNTATRQPRASGGVNRGVAWWKSGGRTRIFLGVSDGRLIALDARTGSVDPEFGKNGTVDLREGMGPGLDGLNYGPTSAPTVFQNLVILGFSCPEGGRPAPGDPRAFDARTGKEVWRFRTIPRPGEYGHDSWSGDSWTRAGAANNWSGTVVDEKNGLVFLGTGSASPDFYGGDRPGDNLFANCTLCLDGRTGRRLWHFQTLRHDLWDHDLPACPNLVTLRHKGRIRDAVAQVAKTGYVYLFDRYTGESLFPIEERPAPASDIPGERTAATQPIPIKPPPFSRQSMTEADLAELSKESAEELRGRFRSYRAGAPFMPPSTNGTVIIPGFHGGATWSGASVDPTTGILYVNSNDQPNILSLLPREDGTFAPSGYQKLLERDGYPAVKPPWGLLNAIDLNRGEFVWQVPLGEFPALAARGLRGTGTENFGGTIVTAGGLVFIGGSMDEKFHAFDKSTGELLWEYKLEAGGYATPCTYMVRNRQFIVVAAGGGGKLGTRSGDGYVAFALPTK